MTIEAVEKQRREVYEVAEAIAPTWERRRADIEAMSTPVRDWMLHELRPREGDTPYARGMTFHQLDAFVPLEPFHGSSAHRRSPQA